MDIRLLETRSSAHDALVCPEELRHVPADFDSPAFAVSGYDLISVVEALISPEPRTRLVAKDATLQQLVFVQRSRIFRFPDTIWFQAVERGSETAILIYSRSNYGYWDLGVNRRRVRRWLAKLTVQIEPQTIKD